MRRTCGRHSIAAAATGMNSHDRLLMIMPPNHVSGEMAKRSDGPWVGLFVTCLVDLFRPAVGFAAIRLLEDAGCADREVGERGR